MSSTVNLPTHTIPGPACRVQLKPVLEVWDGERGAGGGGEGEACTTSKTA